MSVENLFQHIRLPVFLVDSRQRIVYFNAAVDRYRHLARAPIEKGVAYTDIVSSEREEIVRNLLGQTQQGITETVEAEYGDRDGRTYCFEVTYAPYQADDDSMTLVEVRDITPHKTFERKTVRMLREFQDILENANALIFSIDSREYVTEWNRECTRVTGFEKNDILTQRIYRLTDDAGRQQLKRLNARVMEGEPVYGYEVVIRGKDNTAVTLLMNVTPKFNDRGDVVGALFVGQDITELSGYRSSLEQQVRDRTEKLQHALEKERELVKLKNRFVSMASHEFRTPLSSIENAIQVLRSVRGASNVEQETLGRIERQVDVMKSLLEDILTLERGEQHRIRATFQSFDLIAFLDELVEEVLISRKHSHRVKKTIGERKIPMVCDSKLLRNIFINLLSNAMKFSPASDRIEFVVNRIPPGLAEVTIIDYGIGIPPDDLARIYEPFIRGSNTGAIGGTGLGMSIVKRAVDTLNGKLYLDSVPGQGTKATVILPCSPATSDGR
ncbi:MAG TPA: PAS domain-containing sensor histidine kinase [Cyclobacteriaceae bacterium]|nr:PAS domain-containing sensor histidine kinase [Cyclobacteriaceae bacterium]